MSGPPGPAEPFSAAVVRAAYDQVAADYAAVFGDDLVRLPLDRAMLDAAAGRRPGGRPAVDLGCGPAPVSGYLAARGVPVIGADLSAAMLAAGRSLHPGVPLVQADLRHLPIPAASVGLVVAYYCIQHLPRPELGAALAEMRRILVDGGLLLLASHLGDGDVYLDEFLGHHIEPVGGALYARDDLVGQLDRAGFRLEVEEHRGPMPYEAGTRRIYLLARTTGP